MPTKLLGPARWSGLNASSQQIIQGLIGEVTRVEPRNHSNRTDRAAVLVGNQVPDAGGRTRIICPHLASEERYVVFGGNGNRAGLGYRIVGSTGGGWLARCGYSFADGDNPTPIVRQFLGDLADVAKLLDLIVVGLVPRTNDWLTLADMLRMASRRNGFAKLARLHLRVYGPEDYLARLRQHFAMAGGFACIPSNAKQLEPLTEASKKNTVLVERLHDLKLTQKELAAVLGVSQPMVSKIFSGQKLSERLREKIEGLLATRNEGRDDEGDL